MNLGYAVEPVSETARRVNNVFGEGSTTKSTVRNWSKNFKDGDFIFANKPRRRSKSKVIMIIREPQ